MICYVLPPHQITFGTCTKSSQPNSADTYHMEVFLFFFRCFFFMFLFTCFFFYVFVYFYFATFSLQPNTALDEVTVNQDGLYKVLFHTVCHLKLCAIVHFKQDTADLFKPFLQIEFTALMKGTDKKLMRTEVFKVIKSFSQITLSM